MTDLLVPNSCFRFTPKADIARWTNQVRKVPEADITQAGAIWKRPPTEAASLTLDAISGYFTQAYFIARLLQYHEISVTLQPISMPDSLHSW